MGIPRTHLCAVDAAGCLLFSCMPDQSLADTQRRMQYAFADGASIAFTRGYDPVDVI